MCRRFFSCFWFALALPLVGYSALLSAQSSGAIPSESPSMITQESGDSLNQGTPIWNSVDQLLQELQKEAELSAEDLTKLLQELAKLKTETDELSSLSAQLETQCETLKASIKKTDKAMQDSVIIAACIALPVGFIAGCFAFR